MPLLIFIIAWALIEIVLIVQIGQRIGALGVVALVAATALIGLVLLRVQGFTTLARLRAGLDRGELPLRMLVDAFFLGLAGVLLIIPGFLTDALGVVLVLIKLPALITGRYKVAPGGRCAAARGPRVIVNGVEIDPRTGRPVGDGAADSGHRGAGDRRAGDRGGGDRGGGDRDAGANTVIEGEWRDLDSETEDGRK